jgi:hypothetical protein
MSDWKLLNEFVRIGSKWVTLIGEHWLCDKGKKLEYWRVEKVDSVIVLPIQKGRIFCVKPTFRVGIHRSTLDFPGGRLPEGKQPKEIVPLLLKRELSVPATAICNTIALNQKKWIINSSFSNQGLWGFVVEIDDSFMIPESCIGVNVTINNSGISTLLLKLDCLQCRMILLEWLNQRKKLVAC